jgi:hypothetical protein
MIEGMVNSTPCTANPPNDNSSSSLNFDDEILPHLLVA